MDPALQFACGERTLFGLTEDDVRFGLSAGMDGANAIMDKLFYSEFICVEEIGSMLHITMLKETHEVYERLMKWFTANHIDKKTVLRFILWQGGGHRQWEQTVETTLKGKMFSRNPDSCVTCNRCGRSVSKDQVISTWNMRSGAVCPFCGQGLA